MEKEVSAGVLVYRKRDGEIQVLLGKMGGPKYENMSVGAWNIPKGKVKPGESLKETAIREFNEEMFNDVSLDSFKLTEADKEKFVELGVATTSRGKDVHIYALERDFNPDGSFRVEIIANMCETEWPKDSGKKRLVPELSEAFYFKLNVAKRMIFPYQKVFLERLEDKLNSTVIGDDCGICAGACANGEASASTPGATTDSVFGPEGSSHDSLVPPKEKAASDPGLTTSDIRQLYTLNNSKKKKWPVFTRANIDKYLKS